MIERILDECTRHGTCPLNRKEFDEAFAGRDLAVQLRSAFDFARQHDLAFGRSAGDQHFMFSRLPKLPEARLMSRHPGSQKPAGQGHRHSNGNRKPKAMSKAWSFRPF